MHSCGNFFSSWPQIKNERNLKDKDVEVSCKKTEKKKKTEQYRPQHCSDLLKYSEESWRSQETCCHLNFNESPTAKSGVKKSQGMK